MKRHGYLQLAHEVRAGLLSISAATIDRALHEVRVSVEGALDVALRRRPAIRRNHT